jgi:hypothetical protein
MLGMTVSYLSESRPIRGRLDEYLGGARSGSSSDDIGNHPKASFDDQRQRPSSSRHDAIRHDASAMPRQRS